MDFNHAFAIEIVPTILQALHTTLLVAVLSSIGAAAIGFTLEVTRRSGRLAGYAMRFVIDFIRSTPVLAQLYFLFFVLPFYGITLPAMVVGVLGLSIYYSGYLAEVFKAGIDAIHRGQWDAAKALGLSGFDTIIFVIAPQMLRNIAAPMGNYFVSVLKATPYLAVIAVPEMLGSGFDIASDTFRYAEPLVVVGIIFLFLAISIAQLVRLLETRLNAAHNR
ncbi:ectoine/hydroxyectoine ABC transporter permease subunit EhuD [Pelagibius litoralis]|uniref:Ectoine/hydroxyectoine ABC transporter permease subunit EhuD n=1 Tax=Pelagibius litoralis TaxID=374515 RepID=A0A967C257_9PROT|nr:ectoine/hydroxyectoine ABC transporter permease subunit EhuD [Pelagibius litoralis]NIA67868.1 ectoine/hydroxyectoine ABC transporter permease subunit EhuD [Pelagibius litoralis]